MYRLFIALLLTAGTILSSCAQKNKEKEMDNDKNAAAKVLVAYFSATGTTARKAELIAGATSGKIVEIVPEETYSSADLDWNNPRSRSSSEMKNPASRPAIKKEDIDMNGYDVVFLGYPIWWDEAPRAVNTFIESHSLQGKRVVPFATSGGSTIANSVRTLKRTYPEIRWNDGKLLNNADAADVEAWAKSVLHN